MTRFGHISVSSTNYSANSRTTRNRSAKHGASSLRGYRPQQQAPVSESTAVVASPVAPAAIDLPERARPIRGIGARIVENMETSLGVPTATTVRTLPVKILEENRRIINQHQATVAGTKVSFTHIIAWAILRGLERHPEMNARFVESNGKPHVVVEPEVRLGLAIDIEKKQGQRVLLVPNIRQAQSLSFPDFLAAYNDLVMRAREERLSVDDFANTSVTLTNPGMLGTSLSVPRLMQGQGAILGVGSIGYPAEYAGMASQVISRLGFRA